MEHHSTDRTTRRPAIAPAGPAELAAAYEHVSTGRVVVDAHGRVVRANQPAVELAGGDLPAGTPMGAVLECQPPVDWTGADTVTATGVLGPSQYAVTVHRLAVVDAELDLGWSVVEVVDAVSGPPLRDPPPSLRAMTALPVQDAIAVTDAHGHLMYCNDRYVSINEQYFGRRPPIGACVYDVMSAHPRLLLGAVAQVATTVAGDSQITVGPNGDPRVEATTWAETHLDPVVVDGETFAVAVIRDVTERERDRHRLDEALEAAQRASRAKSDFLSRMSHELRTPLNAILGFSRLLGAETTGRPREQLGHITDAGQHLLGLIDEVLDVARLEAGHLSLSLEPVDVPAVCREVVVLMSPLAAEHGVVLDLEAGGHAWAMGDAQRIKQVLLNLVGNALKYAADGRWCGVEVTTTPAGTVEVAVRDRGPGVDPEALQRLFDPFDRLGADLVDQDGSGLGMALARGFAEAMDGHLSVASEVGEGSVFTMTLPASTARPAVTVEGDALDRALRRAPARGRILYVEDDLANVRVVEEVLALRPGAELLTAPDGASGLDLARRHHPDLVLLDMHLPGVGGEGMLAALKADPATEDLPVVVLTADVEPGRVGRAIAHGAADYLLKPVDVVRLLEVVDQFVPAGRRLRVLIADGDELGRQAPSLLLQRAGHTVEAVASGDEAVAAARAAAYDVVLLDEESGGLEAAAAIRVAAAGSEPTVLLLSFASAGALPAGAPVDGVVAKPVSRGAIAALG